MNARKITSGLIEKFVEKLYSEERSEATVSKYARDVRRFADFACGREVDKGLTLAYKEKLGKAGAPSSANSMLAALNSFLRFAGWSDCCVRIFKVQRKIFCSKDMELSREEYARLVSAARKGKGERICLIMETICCTGIRVSELKFITVEAVVAGEAVVRCKGKTRTILIVDELRQKLLGYIKKHKIESGAVFVGRGGKPLSRTTIWRDMKSLCEGAGVNPKKVFPHNLRHLFARTFYGIEKDIAKLADVLGHSNIETTRLYIISTGDEHRRQMERMNLII